MVDVKGRVMFLNIEDIVMNKEYCSYVRDLITDDTILEMRKYPHHGDVNCLKHSIHVSYLSYLVCKGFGYDAKSAARAGLLHDLFLYDWHTCAKETGEHLHGFKHPKIAYENARDKFEINDIEKDMILKHMWPLTIRLPRYRETWVIVMVDKYCCIAEGTRTYKRVFSAKYQHVFG